MYNINPGQARTDLYGINKGEAQVFDTSDVERNIRLDARERAAAERARKKQEADRLDDINTQLGALGTVAYMPRDRALVAEKTKAVRDYTIKNIDKLTKGDPNSMIEFQNLYGDLKTFSESSKNTREAWEQMVNKVSSEPNVWRPETVDYLNDFASTGKAGVHQLDPSMLKHNVDYGDYVLKTLQPAAERMAKESPYAKDFTLEQAKNLIADDLTDAVKHDQAAYDFGKASKEELSRLGNPKNEVEYYQAKYAPKLVVRDREAIPASVQKLGQDDRKLPKVAGTYTNKGDGKAEFQFEYTNTTDNPYLTIQEPNTHKAVEIKPQKVVYDGKNTRLIGLTKPGKDDNGEDVPGKEIELPYNYVSDIMANKFGIKNVYDIQQGNEPDHVTVKRSDVSGVNKGPSYTIKGKKYSLGDLTKLGYTEAQIEKFKDK